jgi:Glu-tRNA(Gln) amidotransferase subunit E-like FAD-binding protein
MGGDMNIDRIKEIQKETGYPDSISVQQALLKVWNECEQEKNTLNRDAEEFLNDKFNGKGCEFKIHDWINGQVSNYPPCELLEEYASQNTLNRDKVMEILNAHDDTLIDQYEDVWGVIPSDSYGEVADALCSLSLPTLSEGEIDKIVEDIAQDDEFQEWEQCVKAGIRKTLKELTKPKEER